MPADRKHDRDLRGRLLRRERAVLAAGRREQVDLALDQFRSLIGQPLVVPLGPAVVDRDAAALDPAGLREPVAKAGDEVRKRRE